VAGKKKFSYYNDYSTVNFGGSGRSTRRSSLSSSGQSRRDDAEHTWCDDCDRTGKCLHCKDGRYPLNKGGTAPCSKCRGSLKCHACRGRGIDGKKCGTPRYEETVEKLNARRLRQVGGIVEAIVSGAITMGGVMGEPTQAGSETTSNWADSSANEEANRQTRDTRGGTRDKGVRDRGTRRDPRR
jgi:hypothetical protein